MNLQLLESFGQNYPEEYDGALDCISLAVTANFNKQGTLLAVGCNDGRVVVWDFMTRGISKIISAHAHPVCSVSWSRNGRKLLTASTDNNACILDVMSGDIENKYRFPSPVLKVQYHPRDANWFLVCPMRHPALFVNVDSSVNSLELEEDDDLNIFASFDRRGTFIYTGNSKGKVTIYKVPELTVEASFRIGQGAGTTAVKSIEFSRRGECFLINSADRIIRVYDTKEIANCGIDGEIEPIQKLQDLVNKTMWKKCCFSGDGDFICAGSARQHALYIWEKSMGTLVKILHGTKGELLLDVVWHPVRPIIASISSGIVSIWAQNQVENWSAFAPDFKELDENVEYEERESEFDIEDEDKIVELEAENGEEEDEIDVTAVESIAAFCSSDEEGEDSSALTYLPIAPDVEDAEESWAPAADQIIATATEDNNKRERYSDHKENSPSGNKRKKPKVYDMNLENAPTDEMHPLLSNKPSKDKPHRKSSTSMHRPKSESKKYHKEK